MKRLSAFVLLVLGAAILLGASDESKIPSMPAAGFGNAVASLKSGFELFSIMGLGPRKTWDDVTNKVYVMTLAHPKWHEGRPVPGVAGRLGASAAGAKGQIVLMGGSVVDAQGEEIIVPDVNVYIDERRWNRGKDIPVPVDRAVVGVEHERFVYLIGGRSSNGPVNNVQVYDVEKDSWTQATPFPGTPVFGLAGGVADGAIVIVDGAKPGPAGGPRYVASDECWLGKIDKKDPYKIEWSKLPAASRSGALRHRRRRLRPRSQDFLFRRHRHSSRLQRRRLRRPARRSMHLHVCLRPASQPMGDHPRGHTRSSG